MKYRVEHLNEYYYPQWKDLLFWKNFVEGMMICCREGYCGLYDGDRQGFSTIKFETEKQAQEFLDEWSRNPY